MYVFCHALWSSPVLRDLKFSQRYHWRFESSGLWRCVIGPVVSRRLDGSYFFHFHGKAVQDMASYRRRLRSLGLPSNCGFVLLLWFQLGQSCDELLERCMWEGKIHNCADLFEERKSSEGFCCSFNYRGLVELKMYVVRSRIGPQETGLTYSICRAHLLHISLLERCTEFYVTQSQHEGLSVSGIVVRE